MKKSLLIFSLPVFLLAHNLEQLLDLAIDNRLVNSYKYSVESLQDEYTSVKKGYYPSVDLEATYAKNNHETASLADKSGTVSASLNYTLYDGNKKEDTFKSYESAIKSSNESLTSVKNQISLDVINHYFSYFSLLSQEEAKQKEIEQLNAQYERLKRFFDAGTTTEDEIQKIISRVESANVNLHEIELEKQRVLHNLEYIIGQKVHLDKGSKIKDLEQYSQKQRADIQALEYDLETKLTNAKIEKSAYYPTITLNNTYTHYDLNYKNSSYSSNLEEQNTVSINMKWNLYSFGQRNSSYESKYKEYLSFKSQYEYEKNKANIDLQLAQKSYDIAKLKINSAQASLKAAQSAYDVIKSKFQNGQIDNIAYLESLTEKYDAISILKAAQFDLEVKKAQMIYHSGENLKDYIQ